MKALNELAKNGGYVCAHYRGQSKHLLGYVKPHSRIKRLRGKWCEASGRAGRIAILKTLALRKSRWVEPSEHAVISAGRPRMGTIVKWPRAGDRIRRIVEKCRHSASFDDLSTQQQEIMCSEFLRLPGANAFGLPRLAHLILPLGRTLKDIDIYGITTTGERLFGQVTHHKYADCGMKLQSLRHYRGNKKEVVLFCDCSERMTDKGVSIVPIRAAYRRFVSTPSGKRWLRAALRVAVQREDD